METIDIHIMEALDKEWSSWLRKCVPWSGFGGTIAQSNRIFDAKRKKWLKRMKRKYDVTMAQLENRYVSD